MPWKEAYVKDLRAEFVLRSIRREMPFRALCAEYGISTKTGYKWRDRFLEVGVAGLEDESRRPHGSPNQLGDERVCELIKLKTRHPSWGPKKIRELLRRGGGGSKTPSLSTVKRVLDRAGLVEHRRRRRTEQCGRIENPGTAEGPNDVWTVDFKGNWYSTNCKRIEPLTVRDDYSRYVLCVEVLKDNQTQTVRRRFEKLFEVYGLPQTIRSDNGAPFASTRSPLGLTRLSSWWVALGISLDRIKPGCPSQNGGHERMHRDIAWEVEGSVEGEIRKHQAALETWRHTFNHERPHEALDMRVPADVYRKSSRPFKSGQIDLVYPPEYLVRRASRTGSISISACSIRISLAVSGWDLGLLPIGEQVFSLWFGPLHLGIIELRTESFSGGLLPPPGRGE